MYIVYYDGAMFLVFLRPNFALHSLGLQSPMKEFNRGTSLEFEPKCCGTSEMVQGRTQLSVIHKSAVAFGLLIGTKIGDLE